MVKEIYDLTHTLSWWCKRISALLEHKHLESMTWHISCHGVIKGSITVLVHQLAGTAHMRSMT